jgi:Na+-driven multidrug efflux pump
MSPFWGFLAIQLSLTGVFRASGNMVTALVLTLVSQWVLQFPLAWFLSRPHVLGPHGLWWAFPASNVVIALITMGVFAKGDWKKKRLTRPAKEDDIIEERINEELSGLRPE